MARRDQIFTSPHHLNDGQYYLTRRLDKTTFNSLMPEASLTNISWLISATTTRIPTHTQNTDMQLWQNTVTSTPQ